jgi:hypothetical protein
MPLVCPWRQDTPRAAVIATMKFSLAERDPRSNVEVTFWESLAGFEARINGQCVVVLREYRTFKQMAIYRWNQLPPVLSFEPYEQAICPRIAVAQ